MLPNGSEIAAIYVVGRQGVPSEWKIRGIEAAIGEFPEILPGPALGSTVKMRQIWEVILVQYDPHGPTLTESMQRIMQRWPDATPRYFEGSDVMYERCRFMIPDMVLKAVYRDV